MRLLDGGRAPIDRLAISRDGRYLAALRANTGLEVWDLRSGSATRFKGMRVPAARLWFAADGRLFEDNIVSQTVHDLAAGTAAPVFEKSGHRPFALTADGTELIVMNSGRPSLLQRLRLRVGGMEPVWEVPLPRLSPGRVAVSADGGTVAFSYVPSGGHGTVAVAVHDGRTGVRRHVIDKIKGEPLSVWVSADGSRVAVLNVKQIVVWDPAAGEAVHKFSPEGVKQVEDWANEPTGTKLATAGQTFVRLWDTATWQEAAAFDWKIGAVTATALAPEGTLAAAGSKTGAIVLWDLDG